MLIALDYDGTYTADPSLWDRFIQSVKDRGHRIICVTMRYPEEPIEPIGIDVVYTSRQAKKPYLESIGTRVNIWIDDNPHWILTPSK
jgi:hypothetical protein